MGGYPGPGIQEQEQLAAHPLRGAIFETWVVCELRKAWLNRGERPLFYFWRDSNGNEVDLLIESASGLMPVEIKSGQTLNRDFFTGLQRWTALAGARECGCWGGERFVEEVLGWGYGRSP